MSTWIRICDLNTTRGSDCKIQSSLPASMSPLPNQVFFCRNRCLASAIKVSFIGLMVLIFASCAPQSVNKAAGLQISGLVIENQTQMWVSAAQLMVPATGRFVSCGNISPQSMCSTGFPETDYTGNPVQITWSQAGQIHSTAEFVLDPPEDLDIGKPAVVRVVITAPGAAGAVIVQDL